uniref:Uncharacterized protein n=1 Tax=Aegilops tauschii subsp. strangulata TaxID=200361 RepID=A0A453F859_AEGTS
MNISSNLGTAANAVKRVTTDETALGLQRWRLALLAILLRKLTVIIQVFIHVASAKKRGIIDGHVRKEMLA